MPFVTSRVDCCNSLLYSISDYNINSLQRIQNSAGHLVTNNRKYYHITPILQKLHWLPVRQCIHFKCLLITYKSSRKHRSSSQKLLQMAVIRLKSYGDCTFRVANPTLWNRLRADISNASKAALSIYIFLIINGNPYMYAVNRVIYKFGGIYGEYRD